jgi:hypothetical protein
VCKTGAPLVGVTLAVERATAPMPEIAYVTDAKGRVRLGLPVGEVALRLFLPDGTSRMTALRVSDEAEQEHDVQIDC